MFKILVLLNIYLILTDCDQIENKVAVVQSCAVRFRDALKALVNGKTPANITKTPCQ